MSEIWRRVQVRNDHDVVDARAVVREIAIHIGFKGSALTLIATAVSEITRNVVEHAREGELEVESIRGKGRPGLEIVVRDRGPGIPDIELALQDGFSTGHGLGLGLPGAKRLMDELEIVSKVGEGTVVTMRKWVP